MAITHTFVRGDGAGQDSTDRGSTRQRVIMLRGSDSETAMYSYLVANALFPALLIGADGGPLEFQSVSRQPRGPLCWLWTGNYADPIVEETRRALDVGEWRVSYDTSGGSVRLFTSYGTTKYGRPGETPADYKGLIAVDAKGEPKGVDVTIPALGVTIEAPVARATAASAAYAKAVARMTGRTNDAAFAGFDADELMFLSARWTATAKSDPTITFQFAASENIDGSPGLTFGDIVNVAKKGHEYLWIQYADEEDLTATPPRVRQIPVAVYVEQIAQPGDFSLFGIGTSQP